MRHQPLWECFNTEREQLQVRLTKRIKENMQSLIGNPESADLLLVAADGRKLAAHLCILRQRAPVFFHRYIQPTFDATPRDHTSKQPILEVAVVT
uniref:BTB domain-containing protein n=1 Tax=Ditylenchus dipsaci TaxID=166011 RepID=A0A915ESF4_9BILA